MANKQISPERQGAYYFGMVLSGVGFALFLSVFFTMLFPCAVIGMVLIIIGQFLMRLGRLGAAGSGMILDPEQTREDVEPWARMAGGVVKDALEEADIAPNPHLHAALLPFDEQLRRLHKLREEGLLSEEEYQDKKQEILKEI